MANAVDPALGDAVLLICPRKKKKEKQNRIRGDLMMEDRSNPQPSKFRKLPGGYVLRKEREVLHVFQLLKGEIMQVSEEANQDQKE